MHHSAIVTSNVQEQQRKYDEGMKFSGGMDRRLYKEVLCGTSNGVKISRNQCSFGKSIPEEENKHIVKGDICLEKMRWLKRSWIGASKGSM